MSNQQYENTCRDRFDSIENAVKESNAQVIGKLECLDKKLFHDNGAECLQSRLNRIDKLAADQEKRWKWVFGSISVVMVGLISKGSYSLITYLMANQK